MRELKTSNIGEWAVVSLSVLILASSAAAEDAYYKDSRPKFWPYPTIQRGWDIQHVGPIGIGLDLNDGDFAMVINRVDAGSPAAKTGKLEPGQIIESINGVVLEDRDPREILGDIITQAEAKDGKLLMRIKSQGEVLVTIPKYGPYSPTWPINCKKSDAIVRGMAGVLAKQEKPSWGAVLFMLSTGDERDLNVVRRWMKGMQNVGEYPWHKGFLGPGVCEYYLRTGDKAVLPMIKRMTDELKEVQYNGAWAGRGRGNFSYMSGGHMNAAGVHCLTFLLLSRMCGVEVDEQMLQTSLRHFYRYAGRGNVSYGDHMPEGGFRDNGKTGGLALAMAAAARLTPEGEESVYAKARDVSAMKSFYATSWFSSAHTGGGIGEIWHHGAMSLMREKRPKQYRSYLDTRRWMMDLSRRHDGSIGISGANKRDGRYDASASEKQISLGTYLALTYTIPRNRLQLFGAPKTRWCKTHQLPKRPWGNEADEAFLSLKPIKHPYITEEMLRNETVETEASLPILMRLIPAFNPGMELKERDLIKYLQHPEYGVRGMAIQSLVDHDRLDLLMPLLKSKDPRLRHLGMIAITGAGKTRAVEQRAITPEIAALIEKMVADPEESWWVKIRAIMALKRLGKEAVARNKPALLKWLKHDDWWFQLAALDTLSLIASDPAHYTDVIPPMTEVFGKSTRNDVIRKAGDPLEHALIHAPENIKSFASEHLIRVFKTIPDQSIDEYGQTINNCSGLRKGSFVGVLNQLPAGREFIIRRPMRTFAYARSGKKDDMYHYKEFEPNEKMLGTWQFLWSQPTSREDLSPNHKKSNMIVATFNDDGTLDCRNAFGGCFWSGNMMINPVAGVALSMRIEKIKGREILLVDNEEMPLEQVPKEKFPYMVFER